MRILIITLLFLFMATAAQAKEMNFSCTTEEGGAYTDVGTLTMTVEGKMIDQGERRKLEYSGEFQLGCGEEWTPNSCWASSPLKYGRTVNQSPYNPRVYKKHRKFSLYMDSDNAYGSFDLIFPKEELIKGKDKFRAQMIMTYINDHWGGSISLDCKKIASFKIPDNFIDLRICAKRVESMVNTVNVCGTDESFDARGCKQEKLGQNIVCKGVTFAPGRGCVMKITMGPMCEKNISTEITRDERDQ